MPSIQPPPASSRRLRFSATLYLLLSAFHLTATTALPHAQAGSLASIGGSLVNQPGSPIFVAYPNDGYRVAYPSVLLEGSVPLGASLRLGTQALPVGTDGLFIAWVPLRPGLNTLRLSAQRGHETWSSTLRVTRTEGAGRPPLRALTLSTPQLAEVIAPDVGLGLNTVQAAWEDDAGRPVLYAREGQKALALAQRGNLTQLQLADGRLVWASRETLRLLPPGTPQNPAVVGSPRRRAAGEDGWQEWAFPVSERTPFILSEGGVRGPGSLRLSLIGARPAEGLLAATSDVGASLQEATLHLDLSLGRPLHGYQAFYRAGEQGDALVVRLREAPAPGRLAGRRIVLDAGHGGSEQGGAGALRLPEKALVLPVTLRIAQLLRAQGAEVVLTRQDDRNLSLYSRTLLAETVQADVLLSIHANAIPDGKDPRSVRGIGSYFTHEQARPLATTLQAALVAAAPEVGDDGLHPGANLALTRPTTQPSVLLELGYLTDAQNLRFLTSAAGQEAYAQAITAGLLQYFATLPE